MSNLFEILLECNKDHLLSRARTDLARREIRVESLNKCINDSQKKKGGTRQGITRRTKRICRISLRTNRLQEELSKGESSSSEKMKRAQVQQVDETPIQKFTENHETIQQLTSQLQQLQGQVNSMNSSGELQDVGSNYGGRLSHVSSQLEMIPSSRALLSPDKRLSLDTWNLSRVQGNVFGNQFSTFDSLRDFLQRISSETRAEIEKQYLLREKASLTSGDGQNYGTIPMPAFA